MAYDFLVFGASFAGSTVAQCLAARNKRVLVIDRLHSVQYVGLALVANESHAFARAINQALNEDAAPRWIALTTTSRASPGTPPGHAWGSS